MKQIIREILINGLGGVVTAAILLVIGSVSGFLKLDSPNSIIKIFVIVLWCLLLSLVTYILFAKKPSQYSKNVKVPAFNTIYKVLASILGLIVTGIFIWILFSLQETRETQTTSVISGQVSWNNLPVEGIIVTLIDGNCDHNAVAKTVTDSSGNFYFGNVKSSNYTIGINDFLSVNEQGGVERNQLYKPSCVSQPFKHKQNRESTQNRILIKVDLKVQPPSLDLYNEFPPLFLWEAYPDTSYYVVGFFQQKPSFKQIFISGPIISTSLYAVELLESGATYNGWVSAYNVNGVEIAQGTISLFTVPYK